MGTPRKAKLPAPEVPTPPLPAYAVEEWPAEKLKPYARNARLHSPEQIAQLRGSFRQFGQVWPLLVRADGTIIAGHGRLEAAKAEGFKTIRVIVANGWTDEQCRAFGLLDNRVPLNAEWDKEILGMELSELQGLGADLEGMGFEPLELAALLGTGAQTGLTDPDEAPEPPANPVATRGDLWALGRHRLLCGDARDVPQMDRFTTNPVAMVFTDPPYGINLDTNFARTNRVHGNSYRPVIGDDQDFDPTFILERFAGSSDIFLWGADYYCQHLPKGGSWVVWDKKKDDLDESIGTGFELCWSKHSHKRMLARFLWSGFTAKEKNEARVHPTQKPVALCKWFFDRWGKPDDVVIDPFVGSGTTIIAAEMTGRICHAIEIDPAYIDVCIKRWQNFTGQKATLDGRTFDEIAAERLPAAA